MSAPCKLVAPLLALGLLADPCFAANRLSLSWTELADWARPDAQIRLSLDDGTRVEGRLIGTKPESLTVSILKRSNRRSHALGEETFARSAVRGIDLRRDKKDSRRKCFAIGATLGVLFGAVGGAMADKRPGNSAALGALVGAASAAALYGGIGYAVGRSRDLAWNPVDILPDP